MFKCPTCKIAKDVWYDTKGGYCHEDIHSEDYHYDREQEEIEREF